MRALLRDRVVIGALAVALGGCTAARDGGLPSNVAQKPRARVDTLRDPATKFERLALKRFRLSLELPDASGWHPARKKSRFVELDHEATGSTLVVRSWLSNDRMIPATCEADARLYREFPRGGELLSTEHRRIAEFESEVRDAVSLGARPTGYVTAFGARGRTCFAFAFTTEASGPDARAAIDERLALTEQRTLATLRALEALSPQSRESHERDDTSPP